MRSAQHRRIEEIFAEASRRPADSQEAFLEQACAGDPSLRSEVDALLTAESEAAGFLERSAWGEELSREAWISRPEPAGIIEMDPEGEIGPYRLLRKLGEGGMSTVYLAVRADNAYRKEVALKLVRPVTGSERLSRFRIERQILAALDHPNIARLLDGCSTREGLPYLVMEYVDGEPIDRFCDLRRLSIHERLELFKKVCVAVHYAHQNLIVHRDLKPTNILVTSAGEPKLLDFGIAKLLNPELGPEEPPETGPWSRLLTLDYASPEQLRGEQITIASDIYSLGVVLCQLLSGRLPRERSRIPRGIEHTVLGEELLPPSKLLVQTAAAATGARSTANSIRALAAARGLEIDQLRRRLRGDLDLVVLKALHGDPQRRYPSAWALAEDLDRYRTGLPIYARRGTLTYRASKFLRRHRWGVAAAAILLVLTLVSAGTIAFQATRIAQERDRFRIERDSKIQTLEFVQGLLQVSDPWQDSKGDFSVQEILAEGVREVEKLEGQALLKAALLDTLGGIYGSWGRYERAEELIREGLELRRRFAGQTSVEVAESLDSLGCILWFRRDFESAVRLFRRALAGRERWLGPEHRDVADTTSNLAVALRALGEHDEAEELDRQALALRRRVLREDHPSVVESLGNLVGALLYKGDLAGAEALSLEVIELRQRIYRADHPYLAVAFNNHASILRDQGRYEKAEEYYRQAIRSWENSLGKDHPQVATAQANLAQLLLLQELNREAEELFRRARKSFGQALGFRHWRSADCQLGLATVDLRRDRLEAAEWTIREALAIYRESLAAKNPRLAVAESLLGEVLLRRGRIEEAGPLLERSYELIRRVTGDSSLQTEQARVRLERLVCDPGTAWDKKRCRELRLPTPAVKTADQDIP